MKDQPPIAQPLWDGMPAEAQAAVSESVDSYKRRIAELEQRLGRNSTNSSRPPSSDPPSLKRRPPAPPSGKNRGGQPGHSASRPPPGPARGSQSGHRLQAAAMPLVRRRPYRRRPRTAPAPGRRAAAGPAGGGRV